MTPTVAVINVLLGVFLIVLVLMHSGRDTGFGGAGFVDAQQGGTHIVERNLTRLTVVVALVWVATIVVLYRMLR
jgi:preprotein translocase subunit SecG